ncbi:MAG: hypothetical protein SGI91_08730 [Alphaproteobacteria bacterium]|nr:hypothetical protein [Alphaproteobacteria bacterium]
MSTSRPPARFREGFARAWGVGLLCGIGAAVVIAIVASIVLAVSFELREGALPAMLQTVVYTAVGATVLAIFPIGPVSGVLGWLLYRNGVISRLAYAGAGLVASVTAPAFLLVAFVETMRYPTTNYAVVSDFGAMLVALAFAIAGAFGGFMAGHVIRRDAAGRT